eukprot:7991827-Alexandrium_andersonii.AAC.1
MGEEAEDLLVPEEEGSRAELRSGQGGVVPEPRAWCHLGWSADCDSAHIRPAVRLDRGSASPDL